MESRNTNSFLSPNETGDGYHSKSSDSGAALALAALRSDSERRPSSKACGGMTKEYADKVGSAKAEASARRCSSLGLTLMTEFDLSGFETSAAPLSSGNPNLPEQIHSTPNEMSTQLPYRPMVGSGTADAFEALRHDFYVQQQQQKLIAKQKRRMSSLSFGSAKGSVGYTQNGNNRSAHEEERNYEMLKLHHLNLMNEIQETALMLNLYEQKQLIRQQQEQMRQIQELQLLEEASSRKEQNIFSQNKQERTNATFDDCRQSKRSKSS